MPRIGASCESRGRAIAMTRALFPLLVIRAQGTQAVLKNWGEAATVIQFLFGLQFIHLLKGVMIFIV